MYTYIYNYLCRCVCICIYMYIYTEREGYVERDCMNIYIYIYMPMLSCAYLLLRLKTHACFVKRTLCGSAQQEYIHFYLHRMHVFRMHWNA